GTAELFAATSLMIFNANAGLSGTLVNKVSTLMRLILTANAGVIFYVMISLDDRLEAYLVSMLIFGICFGLSYRNRT
ncbi:MAG: hypothetical protein EBT93_16315, partial [Alphaproteobacteria bacterium]|nr:hypothetical protein [Alphaproteobacteria bacterium]